MFAIIETGGKQVMVKTGETIFVEKLGGNVGTPVTFKKVLMIDKLIGTPYLPNAFVTGVIQKQGKNRKITIFRTKAKSNWKRKQGHRQAYTRVRINKICNLGGK